MPRPVLRVAALAGVLLGLSACLGDAPREHPLDPLSGQYRDEGSVAGRVTGIYPPFPGREGVRVRLVPQQAGRPELATRTDGAGAFRLDGIPAGLYAVIAERDGFRSAADTVEIAVGNETEVLFRLDALPRVIEQDVRSVHVSRWFPGDSYFLEVARVAVTDDDDPGDVTGVDLVVPDLDGFRAPLERVEEGVYAATLAAEALPGGRVQNLLGRALRFEVWDQSGNAGLGEPVSLVRVIEQTPETVRPQGLEAVADPTPTLEWRPAQLPFDFTYRIDVYFVDGQGIPNLVEMAEGLPPDRLSYTVQTALGAGDHFWSVWVVDEAGNRSRSKEAGFRVMP